MSNDFDPSVDYANPKTTIDDMVALRETVSVMCKLWTNISKTLNTEVVEAEHETHMKQTKRQTLSKSQVKMIVDQHMNDEQESEEDEEKVSEEESKPSLYDDIFE